MGLFKRLLEKLGFSKRPVRVVVVGLDGAGKTSLLNHLKPRAAAVPPDEVTPTVGLATEHFTRGVLAFTAFDMSGAEA
jgi:ADP-ribosylation factor-like protein 6